MKIPGRPAAVVDIGTNTMNLLARTADGTELREVRMPRLGEGVDSSRRLSDAAMRRCFDVAEEYSRVLDDLGIAEPVVVATSASRDARNSAEFLDEIETRLGVRPQLIDGASEGRLAFRGATLDLGQSGRPVMVIDIGGGSTEFVIGSVAPEGAVVERSVSLDIGAVRLTENFLHSDPALPEELSSCLSVLGVYLDDLARELPELASGPELIGVAGTVTTAAAVEIGLAEYDFDTLHGFEISKAAVEDVFRTLATETIAQRLDNPGMYPGREDVIVGGLCVLVAVMRKFGFSSCTTSERNLLDGAMATFVDDVSPTKPRPGDGE